MASHGTRARYQAGCPCSSCRAANAAYDRALRRGERAHGTAKAYREGCPCDDCAAAYTQWAQQAPEPKRISRSEVTHRLDEMEHLIAGSVWPPDAAHRVGWSLETAERAAARHGRHNLAARLAAARRQHLSPSA